MSDVELYGETELKEEHNIWFDECCEVFGPEWHNTVKELLDEGKVPFYSLVESPPEKRLPINITWPRWGLVDGKLMWIVPFLYKDNPVPSQAEGRVHYEEE